VRSLRGLSVILLAALRVAAQTDSGKPASVEGLVTDSVTGAPIPRVHVILRGAIDGGQPGQYGTSAGPDGKFSMAGVAPGTYSVDAKRAGFVMPPSSRDRTHMELKAGDTKTGIEIKLTPTGTIIGHVMNADGEPMEGARVEAEGARSYDFGDTDEHGQFRIGGLPPGRYRVKASRHEIWDGRPEIRTDGTVEVHNAASWYPGVLTEKEAGTVVVRPAGEATGVDIRLVRVPLVRVSGKVVGMPRGAERAGITVWQDTFGTGAELKPDRSFEIWRLDPGKYRLVAEWNGPDGEPVRTTGGDIEVGGSNIDGIELRVVPDSNISGRLEFEDDQVKQTIERYLPAPMVQPEQLGAEAGNQLSAQVGKDGTFRLEKAPEGKYWMGLGYPEAYVKSMRLGSMAIDGAVLDLSNGSNERDLSLLVSAATGSISGTVQDDQGNAAGTVVVLTDAGEESAFGPRQTTARADGVYTFANLPPGSFKLVAVQESDPEIDGGAVLGYENQMETVDIGAGEKVTKDLKRRMPE
jgi:hypothetical protein